MAIILPIPSFNLGHKDNGFQKLKKAEPDNVFG
jgi:hypothetical protein